MIAAPKQSERTSWSELKAASFAHLDRYNLFLKGEELYFIVVGYFSAVTLKCVDMMFCEYLPVEDI